MACYKLIFGPFCGNLLAADRFPFGLNLINTSDPGHRIKDEAMPNRITWVHSLLKKQGVLPQEWELTQCLFGEHLLKKYPDKVVCVVEAEKTAVIGSIFDPDMVWVAVGGKTQLGDKLNVLQGRKILVYPDVDAYDDWVEAFANKPFLSVTVSSYLEDNCTQEERDAQVDIADLLIKWKQEQEAAVPGVLTVEGTEQPQYSFRSDNPVVRDVAKYFSPEVMPEVAALIEDLDLIPISIEQVEPTNYDKNL